MSSENLRESVKVGHGIARFLKEHGVKYIFGIPDGHTLGLYDGILATEGIEHVLFNDERSACFAADAYARVTGSLGVCDAGSAGSMNFPIALAEAKGSASPVLAIVGTIKSKDTLRNIPHDINVADTLAPVTKWTEKVLDAEYLPRFLEFAVKQAINGRPGPVALVISEDVFSSEMRLKHFIPAVEGSCSINSCRSAAARAEVEQALRMMRLAKQPAIFAGGGAVLSGAFAEIKFIAEKLKAPVFSTISGKGIMVPSEEENNMYFGTVGLFGERPNHKFIRKSADLLIVIGNRLTEDDTANFKYPDQRIKMIQIDIDPAEIGLSYSPLGVVGDPKATLFEMIRRLKKKRSVVKYPHVEELRSVHERVEYSNEILAKREKNLKVLREEHEKYRRDDTQKWIESEPIKTQRVLKAISDNMGPDDFLVTDASSSARWIGAYYPVKSLGRKIIVPRGVGPTGFGVGALIGTCLGAKIIYGKDNKSKKVLLTGDGGLMNGGINEFETIKRLGLDCTIVIINNAALGFIKFAQTFLYGKRYYDVDRPKTDFSKLAEAFGGNGSRVEKLADLDGIISKSINSEGFNLVDVLVDPQEILPPSFFI